MKKFIQKNSKSIVGIAVVLLIGGITMSFQDSPFVNQKFDNEQSCNDTIPDRNFESSMKMKEFDQLIKDLDKNLLQVGEEMKKIDFEKIQQQIESSLKEIDMEKIMKDVELSIKSIDMEKIMAEVKASLKDIDWDEKNEEISKALKEAKVEMEKARTEMKEIDMTKMRQELDKAKLEIEKSRDEFKKIDMDKIMAEAKAGIDKAKEELRLIKTMFTEMEKDGLVNSKDGFSIEYKEKELYINGKKQTEKVTDKYRKYFKEDHFKMTIEKE